MSGVALMKIPFWFTTYLKVIGQRVMMTKILKEIIGLNYPHYNASYIYHLRNGSYSSNYIGGSASKDTLNRYISYLKTLYDNSGFVWSSTLDYFDDADNPWTLTYNFKYKCWSNEYWDSGHYCRFGVL